MTSSSGGPARIQSRDAVEPQAPFAYAGLPTRVVFGRRTVRSLSNEPEIAAHSRIMLIAGPRTSRTRLVTQLKQSLGSALVAEIGRVVQHSDVSLVEDAARLAREEKVDLLLAVGGGSASDTAKAVAILLAEGGRLQDHANIFTPPDHYEQRALPNAKLPIVVIPNTLSAAEVTPGLGIHDGAGHKLLFWDQKLAPRLIVLDPEENLETPADVLASTGMNAVAHCVEGLYSRVRNPISDGLAVAGLKSLCRSLPLVVRQPDNIDARGEALIGAHMSGQVIANARVGIHHAMCHSLGVIGGLSHGDANSIMLPHAVAYNRDEVPDRLRVAAEAMNVATHGKSDSWAAEALVEALKDLQRATGVPSSLSEVRLDRAKLPEIAERVMGDRGVYFNPRRTQSSKEVLGILEAAW